MHQWWLFLWIPAFAGMTIKLFCGISLSKVSAIQVREEWHLLKLKSTVILAKARIHMHQWWLFLWIPAFAGMTIKLFCGNNLPK